MTISITSRSEGRKVNIVAGIISVISKGIGRSVNGERCADINIIIGAEHNFSAGVIRGDGRKIHTAKVGEQSFHISDGIADRGKRS